MSAALDIVKSLSAAGVTFSTDGERIRWRNSDGRMTPEIVATLAADKSAVIDFLTGKMRQAERLPKGPDKGEARDLRPNLKLDPLARHDDAETYADALHAYGPMTYGTAMRRLGWGGTRAGQAEAALKQAGRIAFNNNGRAYLVPEKENDQ